MLIVRFRLFYVSIFSGSISFNSRQVYRLQCIIAKYLLRIISTCSLGCLTTEVSVTLLLICVMMDLHEMASSLENACPMECGLTKLRHVNVSIITFYKSADHAIST